MGIKIGRQARLPAEYQEVEWIGTTGTQWIDTGFAMGGVTGIQVETKVTLNTTTQSIPIFGCRKDDSSAANSSTYYHLTPYSSKWYYGTNATEKNAGTYTATVGTEYTIIFNNSNNKISVDNTEIGDTTGATSYSGSKLAISRRGTNYSRDIYYGQFNYHYFKVYNRNTSQYVRDMVPCYRKSDSVIGMYDLVNDVFYTNSGTGTFTKGADISIGIDIDITKIRIASGLTPRLPSAYQEVEYIESSSGQYIDTGFYPTGNSEIEFDFMMLPGSLAGSFGVDSGWEVNAFSVFTDRILCYGTQSQPGATYFTDNTKYKLEFKNLTCYLNGTQMFTYTAETFTSSYSCYLFAKRRINYIEMYATCRVYGLKLWDSGTLERDFVPCYRIADSVIGMYDLVNDQFYTNAGSGTFTKGADISAYKNITKVHLGSTQVRPDGWQPGANTIAYFPFSTDFNDVMGNKTLTVSGPTISGGYASIVGTYQYMKLNSGIGGTDITVSLRYYYSGNSPFNTLLCRDGGGRHHLLFPGTISGFGTAGTLGFYNDYNAQGWYPSTGIATLNARNYITIVKSGTNEKIYLNSVLVLDSNNSFDNASNPIEIIGNSGTSGNQGSIGLLSEFIFESVLWSAQDVADYYNLTKANYGL